MMDDFKEWLARNFAFICIGILIFTYPFVVVMLDEKEKAEKFTISTMDGTVLDDCVPVRFDTSWKGKYITLYDCGMQ